MSNPKQKFQQKRNPCVSVLKPPYLILNSQRVEKRQDMKQFDKTITSALNKIIGHHCRHLVYLKQIFEQDFVIPQEHKATQHRRETYYTTTKTSRNYVFQWHQMSQSNYETRVMFLRDALIDYETYTGTVHRFDADYPELSEIPYNVPSGGTVSANKRLQCNDPCNKPHLIILGAASLKKSLSSLSNTKNMTQNGFHFVN
jgi:hypothetical protein